MSIVANVVTQDGSWIAYDGRATKNGQIVSEKEIKAELINKDVCIGYTGTLDLARAVMSVLQSPENKTAMNKFKSDEVAEAVQKINSIVKRPDDMFAQFLITGINSNGKFATYTVDKDNYLTSYVPSDEIVIYFAVLSTGEHGLDLEPYILAEIKSRGLKTKSIKTGLRKFVCAVSKKDTSVNDNVSFVTLRMDASATCE